MSSCCPTCGQPFPGGGPPGQVVMGPYRLDWAGHAVFLHGERITLSKGEHEVLTMLFERPGQVVTTAELERKVWGRELQAYQYSLKTMVSRLRTKLCMEENGVVIVAIYKVGYQAYAIPRRQRAGMR